MFKRIAIGAVSAGLSLGLVTAAAPSAAAGSNNGTNNWYSTGSCSTSGGRFDATNYDIIVNGNVWQEYHLDADRAGGTGNAPKVYYQKVGTTTWTLLSSWNDFYIRMADQFALYNFRTNFSNGSQCYVIAL